MRTLLKNCRLVEGNYDILIKAEKIEAIEPVRKNKIKNYDRIIDVNSNLVIPAMIDPHVHVRDLEMAAKEDWSSASRAALAGGIAQIFDMPNTIPATTDLKNLDLKREKAAKSLVKAKFYLGATVDNYNELETIFKTSPRDIAGLKIFLAASSSNDVIEDRFYLRKLFELAGKYGLVTVVHTELQSCLDIWQSSNIPQNIENHHLLRNRVAAIDGTKICIDMANEVGNKLTIAHLSTLEEIELISLYRNSSNIFCELTPHHLTLSKNILKQVGNFGKVNPPLRETRDNEVLKTALRLGYIDYIGTDHAPHTRAEKQKYYPDAPSGFPGLETALPVLLTEVKKGELRLEKLGDLTSGNVARIFELDNQGEIKTGNYADLTIIDTQEKYRIDPERFLSKAKYSPFEGREVYGKVLKTIVNGKIYEIDKLDDIKGENNE